MDNKSRQRKKRINKKHKTIDLESESFCCRLADELEKQKHKENKVKMRQSEQID